MQPQTSKDSFQPKWRHFHAQSIVWVQNVLNHDVVFGVADEYNNQYQYRLPAGRVSELPGGAVATLGVKAIVDELIQNNKNDVLRIWDKDVRARYEDEIILRIKEAPLSEQRSTSGMIDLSVKTDNDEAAPAEVPVKSEPIAESEEEEAFAEVTSKLASAVAAKAAAALPNKAVEVKE